MARSWRFTVSLALLLALTALGLVPPAAGAPQSLWSSDTPVLRSPTETPGETCPAGVGRIRYNTTTGQVERCEDGGTYQGIGTGTDGGPFLAKTPQLVTCAHSGDLEPGALTIQPTASMVLVTNQDPQGCALTLSPTGVPDQAVVLILLASSLGGTITVAPQPGVLQMAHPYVMGVGDLLWLHLSSGVFRFAGRSAFPGLGELTSRTIADAVSEETALAIGAGSSTIKIWVDATLGPQLQSTCDGTECPIVLDAPASQDIALKTGGITRVHVAADGRTTLSGTLSGPGVAIPSMCQVIPDVTEADTDMPLASLARAVTITHVWCVYRGAPPTTAAQFRLERGNGTALTHTTPTCQAAGASPATLTAARQAVTAGGALAAHEVLQFDVINTPNPATQTYLLCAGWRVDD